MKLKKSLCVLLVLAMILSFCGCTYDYTFDMTSETRAKVDAALYYTESEYNALDPDNSNGLEMVVLEDGNRYYKNSETKDYSYKELQDEYEIGAMKRNLVYIPCKKIEEQVTNNTDSTDNTDTTTVTENNAGLIENCKCSAEMIEKWKAGDSSINTKMTFIFAEDVIETNGELSEDKRTVKFDYTGSNAEGAIFCYTESGKAEMLADKTAPVIKGLKKKKYYNRETLKKLSITDNYALKSVACNGFDMSCYSVTDNGKKSKYWRLKDTTKYKQGKNKIVATDLNGNTSTFTFLYEDKPPVVKKLQNYSYKKGKITFYVKDKKSGIGKITYTKNYGKEKKLAKKYIKKVKKGKFKGYYKVTIKGTFSDRFDIKVYDKAGNYLNFYGIYIY